MFNRWKSLGRIFAKELEYQTSKLRDKDLFVTYIRDKQTKNTVTRYYGKTKDQSLQATIRFLQKIGGDAVWDAIRTGEPVTRLPMQEPERKIDWRDGANHRYRAQKRIVGEKIEESRKSKKRNKDDDKPSLNNPVAKHAWKFNKSAVFRDRKHDYRRKEKHARKMTDEE